MKLNRRTAVILLALVISARATSFMFSKLCLKTMTPFSLIAIRFTTASILLFALFHRKILSRMTKHVLFSGIVIGSLYFFVLVCEHTGLKTTNASTASFIENLAIIIVPFLRIAETRSLPTRKTVLCALLAIFGVGLLKLAGNSILFTPGELCLLGAATLYATAIIVTTRLTSSGEPFVIGFVQVTTTGVLSWMSVALSRDFTMPSTIPQWSMILMLAIVCTGFGFTLQPVAQSKLSAETAGAFCALGPLVASTLSVIFLKEEFTIVSLAGAALILFSLSIESGFFAGRTGSLVSVPPARPTLTDK